MVATTARFTNNFIDFYLLIFCKLKNVEYNKVVWFDILI